MRKLILLSVILTLHIISYSQPTIDSGDFMNADDTARVSIANDPNIDFSTTGANSVWDFSYLQANNQRLEKAYSLSGVGFLVNIQFGSNAPSEYQSSYYQPFDGLPFDQLGQFLPVNIENISRVSKIDNDSLTFTGYIITVDGNEVAFRSDTIETGYKFPINYQDSCSSRGYSNIDFNPFFNGIFIQYRQRESVVDGHGTLDTPFGTFDALRIHHTIEEQDSLYVDISGFSQWIPINRTTHSYEWWTQNELRPVMRIQTEAVNGNETVTEISYRDEYLGLDAGLDNENVTLSMYPNPAQTEVNIETKSNLQLITIYNTNGEVVSTKKGLNNTWTQISIKDLSPGVYMVYTSTTQGVNISKLIVE
jgi:hypothetical protein